MNQNTKSFRAGELGWRNYGKSKFAATWNDPRGNLLATLDNLVREANSTQGMDAYIGAFETALATLDEMKKHGFSFSGQLSELNADNALLALRANGLIARHDLAGLVALVSNVLTAITHWRQTVPGIRVNLVARSEAPQPIKVELIGQPDRVTTTEVIYNNVGDVSTTIQTEKDAA